MAYDKYSPDKKRSHKGCPNCGELRTENGWDDDVDQYTKYNPEDFPHLNLIDCIKYLRSVTEELVSRLDRHKL